MNTNAVPAKPHAIGDRGGCPITKSMPTDQMRYDENMNSKLEKAL